MAEQGVISKTDAEDSPVPLEEAQENSESIENTVTKSENEPVVKEPAVNEEEMPQVEEEAEETMDACSDDEENEEDEEEPSMHMCGRCKITFTDLATFIQHRAKKTCKKVARTPSPKKSSAKQKGAVAEALDHTETVLTTEQDESTEVTDGNSQSLTVTSIPLFLSHTDGLTLPSMSGNSTAIVVPAGTLQAPGSAIIIPPKLEPGTVVVLSEGLSEEPEVPTTPTPTKKGAKRGRASRKQDSPQKKAKGSSQLTVKIVKQPVVAPFTFKCNKCEARFPTKDACQVHQNSHERIHKCNECSKKYFTVEALKHHKDTYVHNNPCDVCSKVFPSKAHLKKHKLTHSTDQTFTCELCHKEFNVEHNFKSHMRYVHPDKKNHKCEQCGKEFSRKDKLKRHMITHDPNSPRLPCPFKGHTGCEKTFARPDKLKRHLFTHSKEKPFKCDHCGRVFARKDNLTDHLRLHTGIYNYYCKVCGKGMSGPSKLRKHIQSEHPGFTDLDDISPSMVLPNITPRLKPIVKPTATATSATGVKPPLPTSSSSEQEVAIAASSIQERKDGIIGSTEENKSTTNPPASEDKDKESGSSVIASAAPAHSLPVRASPPAMPVEEKQVPVAVAVATVNSPVPVSSPTATPMLVSSPAPMHSSPMTVQSSMSSMSIAMQPLTQQVMQTMPSHVPDAMSSLVAAAISSQLPQVSQQSHSQVMAMQHHPTTLPSPTTTSMQTHIYSQPAKSPLLNLPVCMPGSIYSQVPVTTHMSSMNMQMNQQPQTTMPHIAAVSQALQTHMQKNMHPNLINQMSNAVVCMPLLTTASVIRPSYPVMPPDSMTCAIQSAVAAAAAAYRQSQQQREEEIGSDESESEDEQQMQTAPISVNQTFQQQNPGYPPHTYPVQIPPPPLLHHRSLLNQPFTPPPVTSQMGTTPRVTVLPNEFPYPKQY